MGFCVIGPDCELTDLELLEKAGQAKKFAKQQGKNAVATYVGQMFTQDDLRVVEITSG
jgi:hypothetical protein